RALRCGDTHHRRAGTDLPPAIRVGTSMRSHTAAGTGPKAPLNNRSAMAAAKAAMTARWRRVTKSITSGAVLLASSNISADLPMLRSKLSRAIVISQGVEGDFQGIGCRCPGLGPVPAPEQLAAGVGRFALVNDDRLGNSTEMAAEGG